MAIPIFPGTYHPPLEMRRSVQSRIKRRASELAMVAEERYVDAMNAEVREKKLAEEVIEFWEPSPALSRLLAQVRHQIDHARGLASIIFP